MLAAAVLLSLSFEQVALGDLLHALVRAYEGQRCGTPVDIGRGYRYETCHLRGAFHPSSGRTSGDAPVGGWHDAGDYGRYVVNSGITVGTLLWAWELFPRQFETIDLLGEVRWNLEWMLAMQDEDGGAWHKQTPKEFPPFVMPHEDQSVSYVIGKGSCATANLAAVAAIAARAYRPHDPAFAARNLTASRSAWRWLQRHPNVRFVNPPDVSTGEYGDRDCSDERLWAAAELWRTAGDRDAGEYLRRRVARASPGPPSWQQVGPLALWSHALGGDPSARRRVLRAAEEAVQRASRNEWRIPMRREDFVWGSNAVAANYGMLLLVANELQPDARYLAASRDILHYLLGRNPHSISWVTGFGATSVRAPHHRPSGSDGIDDPWPGLLAGGPNRHRQDPVLKRMPAGTPPMLMYADDEESYASNEVAINWNAPLVFLVAGLLEGER